MRETAEPAPQLTAEELEKQRKSHYFSGNFIAKRMMCNCNRPMPCLESKFIATIDSLRTQLAEAQERETGLREALERVEKDLQKPGKPGVHTYLRGNVHAPGCSACGMRKRVWNALRSARALSGEQANG